MPNDSLQAKLAQQHSAVISACTELVQQQVQQKRGFTGAGIKTALKVVTAVRPTFVQDVVARLLPEFASALQPLYERSLAAAAQQSKPVCDVFGQELSRAQGEAADALLSVTDVRVEAAAPAVRKAYGRLRGGAKPHVEAAVPELGATLARFL